MNDLINYNQHAYISTRESAKRLNVSLGTIQKMVEMGELTAWKTRGGHRRILVQSIDDHLKNRHLSYRNQLIRERILFGIFKYRCLRSPHADCRIKTTRYIYRLPITPN